MVLQYKILYISISITFLFIWASSVSAQIVISEIMYDLEVGSDSGREWIEIFNSSPNAVSLLGWKFYEDETNHGLELEQGNESLESGEYAVIVSDPIKFLPDWPQFSGTLFDSFFSLSNTGETLTIRNSELVDIDSVTYLSEWGAGGDSNSLYYTGSTWSFGTPTPGSGSLSVSQPASQEQEENQTASNNESYSSTSGTSSFTVEQQIVVSAGKDRIVTVGADTLFKGEAIGIIGKPLSGARFVWNFGDGMRKEGPSVLHYYRYPGEHIVTLEVSSGEYTASDRIKVSVNEAKVAITRGTSDVITIANLDEYELDLSWWFVVAGGVSFMLPQHTVILSQYEINLSSDITGLNPVSIKDVALQYPNGEMVVLYSPEYEKPQFENTPIQSNTRAYSQQSIVGAEATLAYSNADSAVVIKDEDEVSERIAKSASVASAVKVSEEDRENPILFMFMLVGIIILGSVSVLFLRRKSRDEITIID